MKLIEKISFINGVPIASGDHFNLLESKGQILKNESTNSRAEGTFWILKKGGILFNLNLSTYQSVKLRIKMLPIVGDNVFVFGVNKKIIGSENIFPGNEEYSEGVFDITEMVKLGENEIYLGSPNMAIDEISVEINDGALENLMIKNPTKLVLEIYHKDVKESQNETFINHLYPNDEVNVENIGIYLFKTVNSKKIVDTLNCSVDSLSSYLIKYTIPQTSVLNEIDVKNDSNMTVSLEKIDLLGNFINESVLFPGERYKGSSFLDEPHILRDSHSGAVVDFFYAKYKGENRNHFSGTELDNLTRAKATTVKFINCEDKEIRLLNKIENGWREIVSVGIGQVYEQATHSGQIWEFAIPQNGNYISTYYFIPSADEYQNVFIIDKKSGVEITFKNNTHFTLKAYKKIGNQRYLFGFIAPQGDLTRFSYKNSEWEFAAMSGETEMGVIHRQTISDKGIYTISGNLINSTSIQNNAENRTVNISNQSIVSVRIQKQLAKMSSVEIGDLAPNGAIAFVCSVGAVLDIRDAYDQTSIGQVIVPSGEGTFNYTFEVKSLHGNNPSRLTINNHTNLILEQIWLDYQGKEVKYNDIQAGGTSEMNTFLTHPWLIKESRSGRVLKRIYGQSKDEIIDIFEQDFLNLEQASNVEINFNNSLPFAVDIYQVTADREEELVGVLQEGDNMSINNTSAAPVRIREHASQEIIDTYLPSVSSTQEFEVKPKAITIEKDADVEIFNLSFFDIDVYTLDSSGQQTKIISIDTRMSAKLNNAKVGQTFFLQEKKSAKVVGCFLATEKPIKYRFAGTELRSAKTTEEAVTLTVKNSSIYSGTLFLVDSEGNKISKGNLARNSQLQLNDVFPGNVYVFIEHHSEILLEQIIIGKPIQGEIIEMQPNPISKTKRSVDELWPGEVAMFTEENYNGDAFIFHADLYSFLDKINDKVRSIKLGPGTAITAFEHTNFGGVNDVYHLDMPNLSDTDVKLTLSSFQISYVIPEATGGISAISRLTEEPIEEADTDINQIKHRSVYRTTISFPVTVAAVDIYTTEESTFEVRGKKYTTDPIKCAKINLGANKQLVITTEAHTMEQAIFMLRANTMEANERFFVFQDTDLYKKILNLEHGSFAKNRERLGVESQLSDNELNGIQTALQNLAATMPTVHANKTHGNKQDLFAVADNMMYDSWGLSFGEDGTQAQFRPLSPEELLIATRHGDDTVIRRNLDKEVGLGWFDDVFDGIKNVAVSAVDVASNAASTVVGGVSSAASTVAGGVTNVASTVAGGISSVVSGVVDTTQTVVSAGVNVAGAVVQVADQAIGKGVDLVSGAANVVVSGASTVGGFVVEGATTVADAISAVPSVIKDVAITAATGIASASATVLKLTIDLGSSIVEFTLDTVDKVKSCIEMIAKKVFSTVKGVVDFFKDLFAWGDIIDTKNMVAAFINEKFDLLTNKALPKLKDKVDNKIAELEEMVTGQLDSIIADFSKNLPDKDDEPSVFDEVKDKINWFFDKVFGNDESEENTTNQVTDNAEIEPANNNTSPIYAVIKDLKDELKNIMEETGKKASSSILDGIESIAAAISGKESPVKRIIIGVLSIVKAIANVGMGVIKVISALIFKLIKLVFVFVKEMLNEVINIPFVSSFYKKITKSELTVIDVIALIIAAPTTVLSKIIYRKSPKELAAPSGQSIGLTNTILPLISSSTLLCLSVVSLIQGGLEFIEGIAIQPPTPGVIPVVDVIVLGINVMLLLVSLTEILNQIDRGVKLSVTGWLIFLLGCTGLVLSAVPVASSFIIGTDEGIGDLIKILTTLFAVVTIPVFLANLLLDVKDSKEADYFTGEKVLGLLGGLIALVPNIGEILKLRSFRRVPEPASVATANSVFGVTIGVQYALNGLAGALIIGGAVASIQNE